MAAPKQPTHTIARRNVYLAVSGKLQEQKVGTPLVLSEKQALKMGAKVKPIKEGKTLDLTKDEPDDTKKDDKKDK